MKDHARRHAPTAYRHGGHNGSSKSLIKQLLLHKKRSPALITDSPSGNTDSTRLFPDGLSSSAIHELPVTLFIDVQSAGSAALPYDSRVRFYSARRSTRRQTTPPLQTPTLRLARSICVARRT